MVLLSWLRLVDATNASKRRCFKRRSLARLASDMPGMSVRGAEDAGGWARSEVVSADELLMPKRAARLSASSSMGIHEAVIGLLTNDDDLILSCAACCMSFMKSLLGEARGRTLRTNRHIGPPNPGEHTHLPDTQLPCPPQNTSAQVSSTEQSELPQPSSH